MDKTFEFALENINKYGDTDIFPFPLENKMFYDNKADVVILLNKIHTDYEEYVRVNSPIHESMLVPSGYTGFRWATQLDPIWNAYYLGLVLSISDEIEKSRIPVEENYVFSYRIKLDDTNKTIFDPDYGWRKFQEESIKLTEEYSHVLICDISHFYSNVYHHRLENSLSKLGVQDKRIEKHIMDFLQRYANIKSYGLPIGGQGSRILAELLLNKTDKLLKANGIRFCRFVDDYHIFAKSEEELYEHLLFLSKVLIENEGLSLQKSKTRIMPSEEFKNNSMLLLKNQEEGSENRHSLFSISYKYDPYSQTAEEDYEALKEEVAKLNIIGILSDELNKSRVHSKVLKKLIQAIRYIDEDLQNDAVVSLIDNIEILAPVFPNLMMMIDNLFDNLIAENQKKVLEIISELIKNEYYLMKIDLNLAFALRVISNKHSDESEGLLINIYKKSTSRLIKRDVILILSKWGVDYWLSDLKNRFSGLDAWEKRSFIIASYYLGDEGKHWRNHNKKAFSDDQLLHRDWMAEKQTQNGSWVLPI